MRGYPDAYDYRINKKNAECFHSESREDALAKLKELRAKKPNVQYTMQSRFCRRDRYGVYNHDYQGRISWSNWSDMKV